MLLNFWKGRLQKMEIETLIKALAPVIERSLDKRLRPLQEKVTHLESENEQFRSLISDMSETLSALPEPEPGEKGQDGKDADVTEMLKVFREICNDIFDSKISSIERKAPYTAEEMIEMIGAKGLFSSEGRGKDGRDGRDAPSIEDLVPVIKELIPAPIKGEDGKDAPSLEEIVEEVKKHIPEPLKGEKGRDAPTLEQVVILFAPY